MALILGFAETRTQYSSIVKFLNTILTLFGLFLISYSIYEIVIHIHEFASFDTLRDFILSPLLAFWFLPFIYLMSVYMVYEEVFIGIKRAIKDDVLLKNAKWQTLLRFNFDTKSLNRWRTNLFILNINTKSELLNSIKGVKNRKKIEADPPKVSADIG